MCIAVWIYLLLNPWTNQKYLTNIFTMDWVTGSGCPDLSTPKLLDQSKDVTVRTYHKLWEDKNGPKNRQKVPESAKNRFNREARVHMFKKEQFDNAHCISSWGQKFKCEFCDKALLIWITIYQVFMKKWNHSNVPFVKNILQ